MKKLILLFLFVILGCDDKPVDNNKVETLPVLTGDSIHVALGIPKDNDPTDDRIIQRHQYWISYNLENGIPNWVSWELNKNWYGDAKRYEGNFITDTTLPVQYQVKHSDYTNSAHDRGHMVRSEERTLNEEDNKSTFLLTNIAPQHSHLNRGPWLDLEIECENLCKRQNKELFVIAGPARLSTVTFGGKVKLPIDFFKIVVVLDSGQNIRNITSTTTVYAVIMPNTLGIQSEDWTKYKTSVDEIEAITKYNFLDFIPDEIENELED